MWYQEEAISLCREIEMIACKYRCHVALTGGVLYKDGARKDLDILIYRERQLDKIDTEGFFKELKDQLDIHKVSGFGWCHKFIKGGRTDGGHIDMFFPEEYKINSPRDGAQQKHYDEGSI